MMDLIDKIKRDVEELTKSEDKNKRFVLMQEINRRLEVLRTDLSAKHIQ